MEPRNFIISGGGTGGHIYPAIAIADEIRRRGAGHRVLFVGAEGKMEMEKVPRAGYEIVGLPMRGLQRRFTLSNLAVPFRLIGSLWRARRLVREFKPHVAVGVGGYASAALGQAAAWAGVPLLLQEQNSHAGLTNRWLARYARKICVAYPGMERYFPAAKTVLCGNPVRQDIGQLASLRAQALTHFGLADGPKTVLVLGGSLGARTINEAFRAGFGQVLAAGHQLIWQTGKGYLEKTRQITGTQAGLYVSDFIYEMHLAYAAADVVVSRAGALSVSEICLAHKPAILVPSPNVAEDHQTKNALALVNQGAAQMVRDAEAGQQLIPALLALLQNQDAQAKLRQSISTLAKPRAAQEIVDEIFKLIR
ncbi:MAG: undecaprenyldiphospho-muramoylpentapeptide beta-N-acetylglucosaminyltransferase [Bernardetiaceae bacterium]|nr:undecaprenyldiphospho-muramoylpentapeptide beta-N-acetylglucosaminyltransferase [Bernardetiaceae bacterium]